MIYLMNIPRYALVVSVFLLSFMFSPMAAGKHIIVVYDVSRSMVKLGTDTYMESEDIRRGNEYLTDLLFTNTSQDLRDRVNDSYIKECDAAYVGKPLYQSGDILTYAEYAEKRDTKLNRAQVSKGEFQRRLPNPITLRQSFYGMVSYLLRAEVEVYDELYRETDDETYWVFVTDGDIDNSGKSDPGIASVLRRHADIEEKFYSPMIFGVFVNKHVKIEVRRLKKRDVIKSIFIATQTKPKEQVEEIQISPDKEGKFFSETLTIDTENSEKTQFHLNSVNVEIIGENNKPLQIMNPDNTIGLLLIDPIELHGARPPHEFHISLPANGEIAAPDNKMKLEVTYSFNGVDEVFPAPIMNYTAEIKTIYVARLSDPDRPAKQLDLLFSDDKYSESLTIQTESPNRDAFQIDQIRGHIQYKDDRKLCDVVVPEKIKRIGEPFTVKVPKQDRLDWYGNEVVLEIDYRYQNETVPKTTIEIPYKLAGGGAGFPLWLLLLLLIPVGVVVYLLIRRILPDPIVHSITLTKVSEAGTPLHETVHFRLENKQNIEFGPRGSNELRFDVGSEAFIHSDKKNLLLFVDEDDEEARILDLPETLTLRRSGDDDEVHVRCEIADDSTGEPEEDDKPIIGSDSADGNPLDR